MRSYSHTITRRTSSVLILQVLGPMNCSRWFSCAALMSSDSMRSSGWLYLGARASSVILSAKL